MKIKIIFITIMIVIIQPYAWTNDSTTLFCAADDVRIRKDPDVKSDIVGKLNAGNAVTVLETGKNIVGITISGIKYKKPWIKIKSKDGIVGWSYGAFFFKRFFAPPKAFEIVTKSDAKKLQLNGLLYPIGWSKGIHFAYVYISTDQCVGRCGIQYVIMGIKKPVFETEVDCDTYMNGPPGSSTETGFDPLWKSGAEYEPWNQAVLKFWKKASLLIHEKLNEYEIVPLQQFSYYRLTAQSAKTAGYHIAMKRDQHCMKQFIIERICSSQRIILYSENHKNDCGEVITLLGYFANPFNKSRIVLLGQGSCGMDIDFIGDSCK